MGHALNDSIQDPDPLPPDARPAHEVDPRHRPRRHRHPDPGREARWPPRAPAARQLGREAFVERVWEWREQYGGHDHRAVQAPRRLAATTTTSASRSTRATSRAVLKVFVELYEKGYIYRDSYMVNWDPGMRLGDLRPRGRGPRGHRHALLHRLPARRGIGRDHGRHRAPRDDARRHRGRRPSRRRALPRLVGETAILPLVGRELPIIADDYVKPEFGTGALKITPGPRPQRLRDRPPARARGDHGDRRGRPHDRRGAGAVRRADRARRPARRWSPTCASRGLIARTEALHRTTVPFSHRSGERIEPLISLQWFMRMDELAARRSTPCASGRVRFKPERWARRLPRLDGEHPALVHLAPAVVGPPDPGLVPRRRDLRRHRAARGRGLGARPRRARHLVRSGAVAVRRRSAGPTTRRRCAPSIPTDVLSTARDIIFLWVARMVMMGIEFIGEIPFPDVYIHSIIQAPDGRRMSQVAGHRHRPARPDRGRPAAAGVRGRRRLPGLRRRRGALRPAAMSSAQDVRFSEEKVAQGRQLTNKLWNASRLILLRRAGPTARAEPDAGGGRGPLDPLAP